MLAEIPLEVVADYYPAFGEVDEYRGLEILSTVPIVVVGGENDVITPIEHTARIIELLPKAEAIRVEECGHLGMIEKNEIFNDALDRLLAQVRDDMAIRRADKSASEPHYDGR
jgi:pimeloyl-ACP methyl ester carboxylesterase